MTLQICTLIVIENNGKIEVQNHYSNLWLNVNVKSPRIA